MILSLYLALLGSAAGCDLATRRIPNWITGGMAAAFVPVAVALRLDPAAMGLHAAVAASVLACCFLAFVLGWLGGGDAKLAAATALWLGPGAVVQFLGLTALFGAALAIVVLLARRIRTWRDPGAAFRGTAEELPYGLAIALGGGFAWPHSDIAFWNAG